MTGNADLFSIDFNRLSVIQNASLQLCSNLSLLYFVYSMLVTAGLSL